MNIQILMNLREFLDIEIMVNLEEFEWCLHMKTRELPDDYIVSELVLLYQTGWTWSMDLRSTEDHSPVLNVAPALVCKIWCHMGGFGPSKGHKVL